MVVVDVDAGVVVVDLNGNVEWLSLGVVGTLWTVTWRGCR